MQTKTSTKLAKSLACAFITATLSVSVMAEDGNACESIYKAAEQVMEARQAGVAMPKMMGLVTNFEGVTDGFKSAYKSIIIAAYEQPQYSTEKMQQRTVTKFANNISLQCYKEL